MLINTADKSVPMQFTVVFSFSFVDKIQCKYFMDVIFLSLK